MTTLTLANDTNDKIIKYSVNHEDPKLIVKKDEKDIYNINMPIISCSNRDDAKYIQSQINTYVNKLCNDIIKNRKKVL